METLEVQRTGIDFQSALGSNSDLPTVGEATEFPGVMQSRIEQSLVSRSTSMLARMLKWTSWRNRSFPEHFIDGQLAVILAKIGLEESVRKVSAPTRPRRRRSARQVRPSCPATVGASLTLTWTRGESNAHMRKRCPREPTR